MAAVSRTRLRDKWKVANTCLDRGAASCGRSPPPPRCVSAVQARVAGDDPKTLGSKLMSTGTTPQHMNAGRKHRPSGSTSFTASASAARSARRYCARRTRSA